MGYLCMDRSCVVHRSLLYARLLYVRTWNDTTIFDTTTLQHDIPAIYGPLVTVRRFTQIFIVFCPFWKFHFSHRLIYFHSIVGISPPLDLILKIYRYGDMGPMGPIHETHHDVFLTNLVQAPIVGVDSRECRRRKGGEGCPAKFGRRCPSQTLLPGGQAPVETVEPTAVVGALVPAASRLGLSNGDGGRGSKPSTIPNRWEGAGAPAPRGSGPR